MKKLLILFVTLLVTAGILGVASSEVVDPEDRVWKIQDYDLSQDQRLSEPFESVETAFDYIRKGDQEFRRRPGQAQKMYEHAEDYLLKASFMYAEIGEEYGIDTKHEIATCNSLQRQVHVFVSQSRRKRKRFGSAF